MDPHSCQLAWPDTVKSVLPLTPLPFMGDGGGGGGGGNHLCAFISINLLLLVMVRMLLQGRKPMQTPGVWVAHLPCPESSPPTQHTHCTPGPPITLSPESFPLRFSQFHSGPRAGDFAAAVPMKSKVNVATEKSLGCKFEIFMLISHCMEKAPGQNCFKLPGQF